VARSFLEPENASAVWAWERVAFCVGRHGGGKTLRDLTAKGTEAEDSAFKAY